MWLRNKFFVHFLEDFKFRRYLAILAFLAIDSSAYSFPPCFKVLARLRRLAAVLFFLQDDVARLPQCAIQRLFRDRSH